MVVTSAWLVCATTALVVFGTGTNGNPAGELNGCPPEGTVGTWIFKESTPSIEKPSECSAEGPWTHETTIELSAPNKAKDEHGNIGVWTNVYNLGFEVQINGRLYYSFFFGRKYPPYSGCYVTWPLYSYGLVHKDWACYIATNKDGQVTRTRTDPFSVYRGPRGQERYTREELEQIVKEANEKSGGSWKAEVYEPFVNLTKLQLLRLRGGEKSWLPRIPTSPPSEQLLQWSKQLPEHFDWREHNVVGDVRNQGYCGSCYAFSALDMVSYRIRVLTNSSTDVTLSPQDVISCDELSDGCQGGLPYLVAGFYGQTTGFVEESCVPYKREETPCPIEKCRRWYTAAHRFVGGYYGACNEIEMQKALLKGPIAVTFFVPNDFVHYKSGIYHQDGAIPDDAGGHAVVIVGYGADPKTKEKYWIAQNSWGSSWGEDGYFRIRRGTNDLGIESAAFEADPIVR